MINKKNDEVFHAYLESDLEYNECTILKVLIIFSSVYGSYSIFDTYANESETNQNLPWQVLVIENYNLTSEESQMGLRLNLGFITLSDGELIEETVNSAVELYYGEIKGKFYLGLFFYPNVFTNINYRWENGKYFEYDDKRAAEVNRKNLKSLLKSLKYALLGRIIEQSSCYISSSGLFEFGVLENAVLENY